VPPKQSPPTQVTPQRKLWRTTWQTLLVHKALPNRSHNIWLPPGWRSP